MAASFDSTLGRTIEVRWATTSCQAVSRRRVHPSRRALEGWSLYGAPWSQPEASGGKSPNTDNGKNKPNPLPRAATSCLRRSMVRRGPTVRVRQRALKILAKRGFLLSDLVQPSTPYEGGA